MPLFARIVSQWLPPATSLDSIVSVEESAQNLCNVLKEAVQATGTRSNGGSGKSAPWWTPECKFARLNYQDSVSENERKIRAKAYRTIVASSKREYWKRQVEGISSNSDVFKIMKWASPKHSIGQIEFHIVKADTPFLLSLSDMDMDKLGVYYDNIHNLLVFPPFKVPVIRRFGHAFLIWGEFSQSFITSSFTSNPCLLTETESRRIHRRF